MVRCFDPDYLSEFLKPIGIIVLVIPAVFSLTTRNVQAQIADTVSNLHSAQSDITGCYIGAYLGCGAQDLSCEGIADFNLRMGKQHALFSRYMEISDSANHAHWAWAEEVKVHGAAPIFFYDPWEGLDNINMGDVETFAQACKNFKDPVFIIFGHEMNGIWYPWGNRPEKYKEKFRQVAEIFHGVAGNVRVCWVPNQNWGYPWGGIDYGDGYTEYYPDGKGTYGQYVDWVGLIFYDKDWDEDNDVAPDMFIANIRYGDEGMDFYEVFAVGKDKPMLIAETGAFDPNDDPPSPSCIRDPVTNDEQAILKNKWISQVYNASLLQDDFPNLNAICYFHVKKIETICTMSCCYENIPVDYRIPDTPPYDLYKNLVSDPYLLSSVILDEPSPDIQANGSDGPVFVTPADAVELTIALDSGDMEGELCDWWFVVLILFPPLDPVLVPIGQIPLFNLPETPLFNAPLPIGIYGFLFILDDVPDGSFGVTWYDYVIVACLPQGVEMEIPPDFEALLKERMEDLIEQ